MSMTVRDYETKKRPLLGSSDNGLVLILAANALLFIILIFLRMVYSITVDGAATAEAAFQKEILYWFTLPAHTNNFSQNFRE